MVKILAERDLKRESWAASSEWLGERVEAAEEEGRGGGSEERPRSRSKKDMRSFQR